MPKVFEYLIVGGLGLYFFYNQQKIKSNLKKNEFAHQLQFEKEFQIYSEIWGKIIEIEKILRRFGRLAEMKDFDGRDDYMKFKSDIVQYSKPLISELGLMTDRNRPFIVEDIFVSLGGLMDILLDAIVKADSFYSMPAVEMQDNFWLEMDNSNQAYRDSMVSISNKIRARIGISAAEGIF